MTCSLCGYVMSPFDADCQRCHGKGIPKAGPNPAAQPEPVRPAWPSSPAPQPVPAPSNGGRRPAAGPPPTNGYAGGDGTLDLGDLTEPPGADGIFVLMLCSAVLYVVGFFAPWASLEFLGVSVGLDGGRGLELLAVGSAALAVMVGGLESFSGKNIGASVIKGVLVAGCLGFAVAEATYMSFFMQFLKWGIGVFLMIAAGLILLVASLCRTHKAALVPVIVLSLLQVGGAAGLGYTEGQKRKEAMSPENIFSQIGKGVQAGTPTITFEKKPRENLEISVNTSVEASVLETSSDLYTNPTPAEGKVFLLCSVSLKNTGTNDSFSVKAGDLQMTDTSGNLVEDKAFVQPLKTMKLLDANLAPGQTAVGEVVFEVTPGTKIEKIQNMVYPSQGN